MEGANITEALDIIANKLATEFQDVRIKTGPNLYLEELVYGILYKIGELKHRITTDNSPIQPVNTNSLTDELTKARLLIKLQGLTSSIVEQINK